MEMVSQNTASRLWEWLERRQLSIVPYNVLHRSNNLERDLPCLKLGQQALNL